MELVFCAYTYNIASCQIQDEETTATIGVDFKVKQLEVEGRKYKLSIWVSGVIDSGCVPEAF